MERGGTDTADVYVGRNRLDYIPCDIHIGGMEYYEGNMRCDAILDADGDSGREAYVVIHHCYVDSGVDRSG